MPENVALLLGLGAWLGTGLLIALVMGRRGYAARGWVAAGAFLGPLALLLAVDSWRHATHPPPATLSSRALASGGGEVDVLVGYDGSPESAAALAAAQELLGSRLGRLTVATVIPYDAPAVVEQTAAAALERKAALIAPFGGSVEVLYGHPSDALLKRTEEGRYHLLVVGTRRAAISKTLLGSVATELARFSPVPVLMVGRASKGPEAAGGRHGSAL